jgi:hypothetical protein
MKSCIRSLCVGVAFLGVVQAYAYTFTFKNNTNVVIDVAMQLVGISEDHHSKTIQPGTEEQFNFGGGRILFCIDTNTVKLARQRSESVMLPVVWTTQHMYDQIMQEVRSTGKTTVTLGTATRRNSGWCGNKNFDIVMDSQNNLRVIMVGL